MTVSTWSVDVSIDATIDGRDKDTNFGSGSHATGLIFIAGAKAAWWRTLYKFDLSAFPGNVDDILHAKLTLFVYQNSGEKSLMRFERIDEHADTWVEGEVTWKDYKTSTAWSTQGGDKTAVDRATANAPGFEIGPSGSLVDFPDFGALARDAIRDRSDKLVFLSRMDDEADDGNDRYIEFHSREEANPPTLTITYGDRLVERSYPRGVGRGVGRGVA